MSEAVERREALDRLAQAAKDYAGIDDPDSMEAVDEDYRLVGRAIDEAASSAQVVPQPNRGKLRTDLEALSVMLGDLYPNSRYSAVASKAAAALSAAPLTVNREALRRAVQGVLWNVSNYPHKAQPYLLGTDTAPLTGKVVDAVLAALSTQPAAGEVTETVWHKDQFYVTIETDAEGLVTISDELLVKLMTESGWVLQPSTPSPAPELFPGTLAALDDLNIRPEADRG